MACPPPLGDNRPSPRKFTLGGVLSCVLIRCSWDRKIVSNNRMHYFDVFVRSTRFRFEQIIVLPTTVASSVAPVATRRHGCDVFVRPVIPARDSNRLFVLPTVPSDVGPVATLPAKEESILPRAKPIPVPKVGHASPRHSYSSHVTACRIIASS